MLSFLSIDGLSTRSLASAEMYIQCVGAVLPTSVAHFSNTRRQGLTVLTTSHDRVYSHSVPLSGKLAHGMPNGCHLHNSHIELGIC